MNYLTLIDENGKTHYGSKLVIPIYSVADRSKANFAKIVYNDYEYAINQKYSFVDSSRTIEIYKEMFGENFATAIINHRVAIGMSKEAVLMSWGKPDDINKTITKNLASEQWIYGKLPNSRYIYLENDVIVSLQL